MRSSVSSWLIVLGLMLAIATDVQAEIKTTPKHNETATELNSTISSNSPASSTSNYLTAPSTTPIIAYTETTATTFNEKNETSTQYTNKTNPAGHVSVSTTNTHTRTAAASTTPLLPVSSTTRAETSVTASTQASDTTQEHSQDKAGFIILGVFVIAIILIVIIIVFLRNKTRRYSFDLYRKNHEDTEIPLSAVGGEGAIEAIASKENSGFDNRKEEKVVNETKASPKTSTSGNGQEKPEIVSNPGVNGEEGRAPCSGEWPEGAQDSCFTEIQLVQTP
ncbi:uncharacterized protein LOC121297001 [Polyodon spathula]|uniref:uncharacterized protein LOC121297001 n=1 Tax=Polyodon spathula TaxID=7913 RepID=UPI001B7F0B19|nr:uncharacterized protein LOC121297001 [Polyodon spathula]